MFSVDSCYRASSTKPIQNNNSYKRAVEISSISTSVVEKICSNIKYFYIVFELRLGNSIVHIAFTLRVSLLLLCYVKFLPWRRRAHSSPNAWPNKYLKLTEVSKNRQKIIRFVWPCSSGRIVKGIQELQLIQQTEERHTFNWYNKVFRLPQNINDE